MASFFPLIQGRDDFSLCSFPKISMPRCRFLRFLFEELGLHWFMECAECEEGFIVVQGWLDFRDSVAVIPKHDKTQIVNGKDGRDGVGAELLIMPIVTDKRMMFGRKVRWRLQTGWQEGRRMAESR